MALLSFRGYAKHRGVSPEAVSKAVRLGRISTVLDEKGQRKIDPAVADQEWKTNTDTAQLRGKEAKKAEEAPPPETGGEEDPAPSVRPGGPTYAQSRAVREAYQARIAKLDYEERAGTLIKADQVRLAAFKLARTTRDAVMSIPDRVAAELAAETNQFKIHKRLTEEIRKALRSLEETESA